MATLTEARLSVPYVNASHTLSLGAALPAVCIMIVAMRFYVRRHQRTSVSIDDWLILGALVCSSFDFLL